MKKLLAITAIIAAAVAITPALAGGWSQEDYDLFEEVVNEKFAATPELESCESQNRIILCAAGTDKAAVETVKRAAVRIVIAARRAAAETD